MGTSTALFDASVHETQQWIAEVMDRLDLQSPHDALHALNAVLHALRDELSVYQNAALAAQMPTMLRGLYFQNWQPQVLEPKHSSREAFLRRIDAAFSRYDVPPNALAVAQNVLEMLAERISGECRKIRRTLPRDLRGLWLFVDDDFDEQ